MYDSYNGYKQCADDCKDATAKLLFQKIAASRADLIAQLSNVIKVDLGVEPYVIYLYKVLMYRHIEYFRIASGSAIGAAHRTRINVKA